MRGKSSLNQANEKTPENFPKSFKQYDDVENIMK
jgi:hypothetical protein